MRVVGIPMTVLALAGLVGCTAAPPPASRPAPADPVAPEVTEPEPAQTSVERYFAQLQERRIAQGLLRTERAPRDLPITRTRLERAFEAVALRDEYQFVGGGASCSKVPLPPCGAGKIRFGSRWNLAIACRQHGACATQALSPISRDAWQQSPDTRFP